MNIIIFIKIFEINAIFWLNIPNIVKFLINCLTSGEKNLRQVGQVKILDVLKSIRQI